jgi:hypothetical protein
MTSHSEPTYVEKRPHTLSSRVPMIIVDMIQILVPAHGVNWNVTRYAKWLPNYSQPEHILMTTGGHGGMQDGMCERTAQAPVYTDNVILYNTESGGHQIRADSHLLTHLHGIL